MNVHTRSDRLVTRRYWRLATIWLILLPFALTACGGQAAPTATGAPDLVATEVAVQRAAAATLTAEAPTATVTGTLAATAMPSATLTVTPRPSRTPQPTIPPAPTRTPLPTIPATGTAAPTATPDLERPPLLPAGAYAALNNRLAAGEFANVVQVAWSHDGRWLGMAGAGGAYLVAADGGSAPGRLWAGPAASLAFHSSNDIVATGAPDGSVLLWDYQAGRALATFKHDASGTDLADLHFGPAGTELFLYFPAAQGSAGEIAAYDIGDPAQPELIYLLNFYSESISSAAAFSADGSSVAIGDFFDGLTLYELSNPPHITANFPDDTAPPSALAIRSDGRRIALGTLAGRVHLFDVDGRLEIARILPPPEVTYTTINAIVFGAGGDVIFGHRFRDSNDGADQGRLALWSASGQQLIAGRYTPAAIMALALEPQGRYLAVATTTAVIIADLDDLYGPAIGQ